MILKSVIQEVVKSQREYLDRKNPGLIRQLEWEIPDIRSHALIITGIRRCGKSTLLHQLMNRWAGGSLYLNFDDPRLFGFALADFERLREISEESGAESLFLDEIQLVPNWERFIRQLVDQKQVRIVLTGSNAEMLSREMGTHLTGRHLSKELFPFSFNEFADFQDIPHDQDATRAYMKTGGFPDFILSQNPEILTAVLKDILYRDISVRYGVRNHGAIEQLAVHLFSNIARPVTANSLRKLLNVSAASTISEYMSYFEQTYLFSFVRKFSYSYKEQVHNPRKPYAVDPGLAYHNSISFSEDSGRYLENAVFLSLRRKPGEIFYFSGLGECDFVIMEKGKVGRLIQVCYQLTADNMDRELNGLREAMRFFNLSQGEIVTFGQEEFIKEDGLEIMVRPFHRFA
jgi:predicted AAA+ superfamily ATPase